jgi:hypothetical protein
MSTATLTLKVPEIWNLRIDGRVQDRMVHHYSFFPPADLKDWPKSLSEITNENLKYCLHPRFVGLDAVGRTPFNLQVY